MAFDERWRQPRNTACDSPKLLAGVHRQGCCDLSVQHGRARWWAAQSLLSERAARKAAQSDYLPDSLAVTKWGAKKKRKLGVRAIRRRSASHAAAALGSQLSSKRIEHESSQPVGEQPFTGAASPKIAGWRQREAALADEQG